LLLLRSRRDAPGGEKKQAGQVSWPRTNLLPKVMSLSSSAGVLFERVFRRVGSPVLFSALSPDKTQRRAKKNRCLGKDKKISRALGRGGNV